MIQINVNGEAVDLPAGFSMEIEESSPIFNERGSQSVPATVPATRRNRRLLDFPDRLDTDRDPNLPERVAVISDGPYYRRGLVNVTSAGRDEGITFNVGFDNSTAYAKWQAKKLAQLSNLPVWLPNQDLQDYPIDQVMSYCYGLYTRPDGRDPLAVFPVAISKETQNGNNTETNYWEILNVPQKGGFRQPTTVKRILNGEVTDVTVPEGYMISPFIRVWKLVDLVFTDMGLTIDGVNPFTQGDLSLLVVLNNAADAICTEKINYADLMPDSTVEEFLKALWVRFGLVYNINYDTMTVKLRFLRDIIRQAGNFDIDRLTSARPLTNYEARQYVKLSAKTSLEGAAPACERFEDFIKNLDPSKVKLGTDVSLWTNTGTQDDPVWDGDVRDDWYDQDDPWRDDPDPEPPDPDYPEPDDDRDDGRDDYDMYAARSRAAAPAAQAGSAAVSTEASFLAREFVSGNWYRLDSSNNKVRAASTSFFQWDPQPQGHSALDLSSDDEFVPVDRVTNVGTGTGNEINDVMPMYLAGARHYHSYIKGGEEEDSGETTPLAFMFAYGVNGVTIGRFTPEGNDGQPITLDEGWKPSTSLLFQFKDGLFARYWADYDEILRHGARTVEVKARFNKTEVFALDLLWAVRLNNIRCLIDTATYSLPAGRDVAVDLKLRPISTQGTYDIKAEQNVPDFSAASRHLEWALYSETYDQIDPELTATKQEAAQNYIDGHDYEPHGTEGDYWFVGARGLVFKSKTRDAKTWQNDPLALPTPGNTSQTVQRTYQAVLEYDVYEIHDMSVQDGPEDMELDEVALGTAKVWVDYNVVLRPRWVYDK